MEGILKRTYLFILFMAVGFPVFAKRNPPPFLYPVDDGIYRYVVRENGLPDKKHVYKGGHVVAYLKITGEVVWEKYLYKVKLDPEVEEDVQNVYLQQMYLDDPDRLVLQNERGEWFVLDRRNGNPLTVEKFKRKELEKRDEVEDEDLTERAGPLLDGNFLIIADPGVTYGHQRVQAYDVPTGRLLWEKKVQNPRGPNGGRSHISLMVIHDHHQLELTFEDSTQCRLDAKTGHAIR